MNEAIRDVGRILTAWRFTAAYHIKKAFLFVGSRCTGLLAGCRWPAVGIASAGSWDRSRSATWAADAAASKTQLFVLLALKGSCLLGLLAHVAISCRSH